MRIKLAILLMIFFCSCGSKRTNDSSYSDSIIKIDLLSEPGPKVQKLSEFAANIEYIPIQTTKNSLMGNFISKIVTMGKRIYLKNTNEILCFDTDGKFLFKLNKSGRGPEEYTNIGDFDISSDNKSIIIRSQKRLIVYEISDFGFTFQSSVTLQDPAPYLIGMVPETDNVFMAIGPFTGSEPTLSLMVNTTGDTINFKPNCYKYENVRKRNSMALNEMLVYSFENMVCFKEKFSDTVFYADAKDNYFKPRVIFDSHGTLVTPEMRGGSQEVSINTTYVPYVLETSRYIFYWYFKGDPLNGILFDKRTNKKYKLDSPTDMKVKLPDDIAGGPDFTIEFIAVGVGFFHLLMRSH
jgi:hypothetical protein